MYEEYYSKQSGGGEIPVFVGSRYQRGHGLGNILSGLFRRVLPFLKANAKNLASNVLRTGVDIAEDVFGEGKKLSDSVKDRLPQGLKRTVQNLEWQTGSGLTKRRKLNRKSIDIFSRNGIRSRSIM